MADQVPAAAATGASNGTPAQPAPNAAPALPAGYRAISEADYENLNTTRTKFQGMNPLAERAVAMGFKKPEDFDNYKPLVEALNKRKMTPAQVAAFLSQDVNQDGTNGSAEPSVDWEAKIAEATSKTEANMLRRMAEKEANEADKLLPNHLETGLKGYFGDESPDDYQRELHTHAVKGWMYDNAIEPFPSDHPLHKDRPAPFSDKQVAKALEYFKTKKSAQLASKASAIADAAKKRTSTPAGSGGGQGKPDTKEPSPGKASWKNDLRGDAEAFASQREAARNR